MIVVLVNNIAYTTRFLLRAKEAKPDITPEQLSFDNRVRQFAKPDQIFNYFSSIQLVNEFGTELAMSCPLRMKSYVYSRSEDCDDVADGFLQLHHS